jgi:hypothetical protein
MRSASTHSMPAGLINLGGNSPERQYKPATWRLKVCARLFPKRSVGARQNGRRQCHVNGSAQAALGGYVLFSDGSIISSGSTTSAASYPKATIGLSAACSENRSG